MLSWIKKLLKNQQSAPMNVQERTRGREPWELCMMMGFFHSHRFDSVLRVDPDRVQTSVDEELEELSRKLPFCSSQESYELITDTMQRIDYRVFGAMDLPLAS